MKFVLPLLGMVITAIATVTAVVFCLAMGANATPAQIRANKRWMVGISLLGLAGIVSGILLLRAGKESWAVGASFAPTAFILFIFVVALNK